MLPWPKKTAATRIRKSSGTANVTSTTLIEEVVREAAQRRRRSHRR